MAGQPVQPPTPLPPPPSVAPAADPALEFPEEEPESAVFEQLLSAITDVLRAGASPEAQEAQRLLLRRMALEGAIGTSRLPAPRNITEIGGYLNLLTEFAHTSMRTAMLASAIGVAGVSAETNRSRGSRTVSIANDRPDVPCQRSIPLSFEVRADFAGPLQAAMEEIRGRGCALPLTLPHVSNGHVDLLLAAGRILDVFPACIMADPETDPVAIARSAASPVDALVGRVLDERTDLAEEPWVARRRGEAGVEEVSVVAHFVPLAPILARAGWYQLESPSLATGSAPVATTVRLVNATGLIDGVSRFADEIGAIYDESEIGRRGLGPFLWRTWSANAGSFVAPT